VVGAEEQSFLQKPDSGSDGYHSDGKDLTEGVLADAAFQFANPLEAIRQPSPKIEGCR